MALTRLEATGLSVGGGLTVGVVHLAKRALVRALPAAEDVASETGSTIVWATRGR